MTYEEFNKELKELNLSKNDFSQMVNMNYSSITNWKQSGNLPSWLKSWLQNYRKALILDKITKEIKAYL